MASEAKMRTLFSVAKKGFVDEKLQLEFYKIAQKARLIPNLPQPVDKTIEQLAEFLEELCVRRTLNGEEWSGTRQAEWLMREIRDWEKWAGPAGLKRVYDTKFRHELDTYKSPETADSCPRCRDRSHRYVIVVDGHAHWCDCAGARQIKERDPGWLEHIEQSLATSQEAHKDQPLRFSASRNITKLMSEL